MSDDRFDRRTLLKGMAALGAGAGLAACGWRPHGHGGGSWGRVLPPGSRPFPRIPEGTDMLPEIEHVVVLMMENHSYDSYFGALRRADGFRFGPDGKPRNANPDGNGNLIRSFHMPSTCQLHALPGQDWNRSHTSWDGGRNDGFVRAST
jgi:phospholipase C